MSVWYVPKFENIFILENNVFYSEYDFVTMEFNIKSCNDEFWENVVYLGLL